MIVVVTGSPCELKKICYFMSNLNQRFKQNTADKVLRRGYWTLCEYELRKNGLKMRRDATFGGITITPTLRLISRMTPVSGMSNEANNILVKFVYL